MSAKPRMLITGLDTAFKPDATPLLAKPQQARARMPLGANPMEIPAPWTPPEHPDGQAVVSSFMQKKVLLDPMCSPFASPDPTPTGTPTDSPREPGEPKQPIIPSGACMPQAGLFASGCVLTNSMLGVGVLGLPWSTSTVGLGLGATFMVGAACMAGLALHFLSAIAMKSIHGAQGPAEVSFYAICVSVAPKSRYIVDVALAFKCFGVATGFLQVIAQSAVSLVHAAHYAATGYHLEFEYLRSIILVFVVGVVIAPRVFHKRITKTYKSNMVAIGSWIYVASLVVYYYLRPAIPGSEPVHSDWSVALPEAASLGVVASTMPVFIFGFTCHQNLFPIANELQERSVPRLDKIIIGAIGTGALIYGSVSYTGYTQFGSKLQANFVTNLPREPPVILAECLICMAVVLTYPLQLHPCRRSLMIMVQSFMKRFFSRSEERKCRRIFTVAILFGTLCVAICVKDLGLTLAFVGAIGSNTVVLIMPAFLYTQVFKEERGPLWYVAWVMFIFGCIILPTSLCATIQKAMSGGPLPPH